MYVTSLGKQIANMMINRSFLSLFPPVASTLRQIPSILFFKKMLFLDCFNFRGNSYSKMKDMKQALSYRPLPGIYTKTLSFIPSFWHSYIHIFNQINIQCSHYYDYGIII